MKAYRGENRDGFASVLVIDDVAKTVQPLRLRDDLIPPPPKGVAPVVHEFDWGRICHGARVLALSLLADATGNDEVARLYTFAFANLFTARLDPDSDWAISDTAVQALLNFTIAQAQFLKAVAEQNRLEGTQPEGNA